MGFIGTWWSQSAMGTAWRIGVSESDETYLVMDGPFRFVRNPVITFVLVSLMGFTLFLPNILTIVASTLAWLSIEIQVRFVEEPYLRRELGGAYHTYQQTVGRFFPWVGLERTHSGTEGRHS